MDAELLQISDGGTSHISFLFPGSNIVCTNWQPVLSQAKEGGTWASNPLRDGRQLISKVLDNAIETFTFSVVGKDQDVVADEARHFRMLLKKASLYWTNEFVPTPVYMVARSKNETNTRYALIYDWSIPGDQDPYQNAFFDCPSVNDELTLTIERGHWMSFEYLENTTNRTHTQVPLSAISTLVPRAYGPTDQLGGVFVANSFRNTNIDRMYYYDNSTTTWTANLAAVSDTPLLPAIPAVGDFVIFGSTTWPQPSYFTNIVFEFSVLGVGFNGSWRFSNGVSANPTAWPTFISVDATLAIKDNTLGLKYPINSPQVVNWDPTIVNTDAWVAENPTTAGGALGVTCLWVAFVVTSLGGGGPTAPSIEGLIYSAAAPFVDVAGDDIGGELDSLMRIFVNGQFLTNYRIVCGTRKLDRGVDFNPCLDASDHFTPPPIGCTVTGANVAFVHDPIAPTGALAQYTPAGAEVIEDKLRWTLSGHPWDVSRDYRGQFRVYLWYRQTGGASGDFTAYINAYGMQGEETYLYNQMTNHAYVADLGVIYSPDSIIQGEKTGDLLIDLYLGNSNVAPGILDVIGLYLLPIDEYSFEIRPREFGDAAAEMLDANTVLIDGYGNPKYGERAFLISGNNYTYEYTFSTLKLPYLDPGYDVRLWFLFLKENDNSGIWSTPGLNYITMQITVYLFKQYYSLRGTE